MKCRSERTRFRSGCVFFMSAANSCRRIRCCSHQGPARWQLVAQVIVESGCRCTIVGGSRSDRGCVGCVDLIPVVGYEADIYGVAARNAFTKPEEQATVFAEAFEIGWPGGPFLPSKSKRSSCERGCQEKILSPPLAEGGVACIQPRSHRRRDQGYST
jgi:hypothetical protein